MIALCFLSTTTGALHGALEVDFVTNRGTITAVMEYEKAPKAVASLISLATGSRTYVDSATGRVMKGTFFNGLEFFKVVDTAGQKTIETGSPGGQGGDGPGYTFPDEMDPSLTHVPYVLSMETSCPNTNGSSFCFTGNLAMPERDGRNVVFGQVADSVSRSVIDAILAAGSGSSELVSVAVRRTDPAAQGFDVETVDLPEVSPVAGNLQVSPGGAVEWLGQQPPFSVLRAYKSEELTRWEPRFRSMCGLDDVPSAGPLVVDYADVPARFYHFSLTSYPDAGGVTGMANRTLVVESPGVGMLIYQFNSAGDGGIYENVVFPGDPPFFSGSFTVSELFSPVFEPYSFEILLHAVGLGGSPYNYIRAGVDQTGSSSVTGRHVTVFSSDLMTPVFEDVGLFELSRP